MSDARRTKRELLQELHTLRNRIARLEQAAGNKAYEPSMDSNQVFRTIFENVADGILLADAETKRFYMGNRVICQMLGYAPEEIKKLHITDIHPAENLPHVVEQFDKQVRGELTLAEDVLIKRRDGSVFYADVNSFPITLGARTYLLGVFRDITKSKQREEQLNFYRETMARTEQLASLRTLNATMAHEMTQPLTVIRMSIENTLAELGKSQTVSCSSPVVEDLKEGLNAISNITSLIDRYRNFARRPSNIPVRQVYLREIAERIVKLLDQSAWRARVTLRIRGMDKLPPLYWYEKDLEQLFFALIENAIQAADGKNGRRIIISGAVKGEQVELQFADSCGGIAPKNLDRIFEPFFTTKDEGEGTGLGLCTVQNIVSRADGDVRVESTAGKGSTFFVTLPINRGKP